MLGGNLFLGYMLCLPKEVVFYSFIVKKILLVLILSMFRGWGIIKLNVTNFFSRFYSLLFVVYLGMYKNFNFFFKFRGVGFKVSVLKSNLIFKLGYSHRILYSINSNKKIYYKEKQVLDISSRNWLHIKKLFYFFQKLNVRKKYKKKGVFFKGMFFFFKLSSKKAKF